MNILLVSDDHGMLGFEKAYNDACAKYGTIEMVLHAGDTEGNSEKYYRDICGCQIYIVNGNNDDYINPEYAVVKAMNKTIFLTHGHLYGVYAGMEKLYFAALEKKADIAVFGHTHRAYHETADSVEMINPGSLTLPRGGRYGMYAVLSIDDNGKTNVEHFTIN